MCKTIKSQRCDYFFAFFRKLCYVQGNGGRNMQIHTAYDVMKEFLITDAELVGQYGIPKIPKTFIHPGKCSDRSASRYSAYKKTGETKWRK